MDQLQSMRKLVKPDGDAHAREDERQAQITGYISRDPALPEGQFNLCLYLLTVMVLMCHLTFSFVNNHYVREFLRALRPNFEKKLGGLTKGLRLRMRGDLLDEVYEEAVAISEEVIAAQPGLTTFGIDGHKDGRGRTLETFTKAKLGVSVFAGCEYMLTERATGARMAVSVKRFILKEPHMYIAVVADNTGSNWSMFESLSQIALLSHMFFLGCCVHVLDLLVEDVAKLPKFSAMSKQAHEVIAFIKKHSILYEEFLAAKAEQKIRSDLHLFPATRFAYLYLMLMSLHKTMSAVRVMSESGVYKLSKDIVRKRGGDEGKKALEKFNSFEDIIDSRSFKTRLNLCASVLMPFSCALHYLEGDKVPISHVYPVYQALFSYVQGLKDEVDKSLQDFLEESDIEKMIELVQTRWHGKTRTVGLKANAHMLAFTLDPYAQAAVTNPTEPSCLLFNTEVHHRPSLDH